VAGRDEHGVTGRQRGAAEPEERRVETGALGVRCVVEGPAEAPVVTLAHALAADLSVWDAQVTALAREHRVVRFDFRGHGGTDAPPGPYDLEQLAEDVRALLAALDVARTHFVGLSLGGMVGQTLALAHPELFLSLTLCDTSSRTPAEALPVWDERIRTALERGMEPLVEPTLERWLTPLFRIRRPDVARRIGDVIRSTPPEGYAGCCRAIARLDLTDRLGGIAIPTLVIVGEEDPAAAPAIAREIHERIAGSQLAVLPAARHLANVEQPELFNRTLESFLARVG
jgi:3-oxoadipate enol-lactonase